MIKRADMQLTVAVYDTCDLIDKKTENIILQTNCNLIVNSKNKDEFQSYIKNTKPHIIIVSFNEKSYHSTINFVESLEGLIHIGIVYLSRSNEDFLLKKVATTRFIQFLVWPCKEENLLSTLALSSYRHKLFTLSLGSDYTYNPHTKELFCNNQPIYLTNNESKLLYLLIQARDNVVKKEFIDHEDMAK